MPEIGQTISHHRFWKRMTLSIGAKRAHYEITNQFGRIGMGELYSAKDQKLGWDMAIKLLPDKFSKDAHPIARFQRQAKLA
jgi:serine/threonine protein kinase